MYFFASCLLRDSENEELRLHKFVVVYLHILKNDSYMALASWTMQSLVLLFEDFYIRTDNTVLQPYNWPRQMTRGWVLLLLNIRLHVKGFNKLIYIGTFK